MLRSTLKEARTSAQKSSSLAISSAGRLPVALAAARTRSIALAWKAATAAKRNKERRSIQGLYHVPIYPTRAARDREVAGRQTGVRPLDFAISRETSRRIILNSSSSRTRRAASSAIRSSPESAGLEGPAAFFREPALSVFVNTERIGVLYMIA